MSWSDEMAELAEDLRDETVGFGVSVILTPSGGSPVTGPAIVDLDARTQTVQDGAVLEAVAVVAEIRISDFGGTRPASGWHVALEDGSAGPWIIVQVLDTIPGSVDCWLEEVMT